MLRALWVFFDTFPCPSFWLRCFRDKSPLFLLVMIRRGILVLPTEVSQVECAEGLYFVQISTLPTSITLIYFTKDVRIYIRRLGNRPSPRISYRSSSRADFVLLLSKNCRKLLAPVALVEFAHCEPISLPGSMSALGPSSFLLPLVTASNGER